MGTMRNSLLESFVFLWLMASGHAILPLPYIKEKSSSRNDLADALSLKSQSTSSSSSDSTYECLYVSADLPPCDFERMEDSVEDITHSTMDYRETNGSPENFGKDQSFRPRRNADDSAKRHVIVYTIEGCLPSRLPFAMPSCQEENSLDKIVEVRKLYPFTVKGLTKPPLVFPEFNFDRWIRMIKRLHNRVSSTANSEKYDPFKEVPINSESPYRRVNEFKKTATTKEVTPKATIASTNLSKGSSPNNFIARNQKKPAERKNTKQEEIKDTSSRGSEKLERKESQDSFTPLEIEKKTDASVRRSFKASNEMKIHKKNEDTRGKKSEPYSKIFYARQGSKVFEEEQEQDQETDLQNNNDDDVKSRIIPEISIPSSIARNTEKSLESNENLYRQPIILEDSSNDLGIVGDSNFFSNLPADAAGRSYEGNNEFAYSKASRFNENNGISGAPNDLSSSAEVIAESWRKRREIRVAGELPGQTIRQEAKAPGIVGKSHVQRSRKLREAGNSRGNGLDVPGKWNRHTKGKSSVSVKQGIASGYRGSFGNEPLKSNSRDTVENLMLKSRSAFPYQQKDFRGKIAGQDAFSRKGLIEKIARKKYGNRSKLISKYGRRSGRQ